MKSVITSMNSFETNLISCVLFDRLRRERDERYCIRIYVPDEQSSPSGRCRSSLYTLSVSLHVYAGLFHTFLSTNSSPLTIHNNMIYLLLP